MTGALRSFTKTITGSMTMTSKLEIDANSIAACMPCEPLPDDVSLTNAELVQLRIRVIALENLVIALLAGAPNRQLALALDMAAYISPRAGFTPHPVTLRAADEMRSLLDRADRYVRPLPP